MPTVPIDTAPSIESALRRAADRYRPLGRSAYGWARGKLLRDPAYRAVLAQLPQSGLLLDLGCAEGYLIAAVRTHLPAWRAIGIDHDERRLAVARRALCPCDRIELRRADASAVRIPDADTITLIDVLHYMPGERQDALVDACARALRPGGLLLIRDVEPARTWRSMLTVSCERVGRAVGRHRGHGLHFRSLSAAADRCAIAGLTSSIEVCAAGTPFSNRLLIASRP